MNDTTKNPLPREAMDALMVAAALTEPTIEHDDERIHLLVPDGFMAKDVTDPDRLPDHIEQAVTVDERASLSTYANRFSDKRSIIIADYDAGMITAHLDWHTDSEHGPSPQHATHRATLALRDSEEYKRWNQMENGLHTQTDFAFFIEENVADVIDPDSSTLVEICRELEATQGASFKSGVRLDNGDRAFIYEDETRVKNEMSVPTEITLAIPLYKGEEPTEIKAKFRFRVKPDGLFLGFNWHRVEYQRQAKFAELAHTAAEETGLPLFFGRT